MLRELSSQGYLTLFSTSDSKHFGVINNFAKHQVVNKPRASKIKGLELIPESYGSDTGGLPLGMDQGSGNGKETPSLCARESFESPGPNHNSIIDDRIPPAGGSSPLGKFLMTGDWMPEADFVQKAAVWGKPISGGYTTSELAQFRDYWIAEGKVFHQAQWEQKLAQSICHARTSKQTSRGQHESTSPASSTSGKSRARQKIEDAYQSKFGRPLVGSVGDNGRDLLGQMGSQERDRAIISLDSGDWQSE